MTPRQFFNGVYGKRQYDSEKQESERHLLAYLTKWHVLRTGMLTEKDQKKVIKDRHPWEDDYNRKSDTPISYDAIKGELHELERETNNNKVIRKPRN